MDPLVQYYKWQAGRGRQDIGPIYATPYLLQSGHGLSNVLAGLFRTLRPILWSVAKSVGKEAIKALGRKALRTDTNIIRDVAANPSEQTTDIISRHVTASTQNMIDRLRGSGLRKRKRAVSTTTKNVKRKRRRKTPIKGITFHNLLHLRHYDGGHSFRQ
jgi:hypothetical protein